jgi:hypothetical protein
VAESDESRHSLYLGDVDAVEDPGHPGVVLQGDALAVRLNNSYLILSMNSSFSR